MIKVCPYCSNVNVTNLKKSLGEENVKTGCIGACRRYKTESVGLINNVLVVKSNEQELINYAKNKK